MRTKSLFAVAVIFLSLSAFPQFIPGFKNFRYFMSPAEVRELLGSNGFAAGDLQERYGELCQIPYFTQELLAFDSRNRQFVPLTFSTNIPDLMAKTERKVQHLTSRNARDFMQIFVPAYRSSNEFRDWDHQYIFYRNPIGLARDAKTNAYQLFAIVLTFRGEQVVGDWRFLQSGFSGWVSGELRRQYGLPESVDDIRYDKLTRIVLQHFRHSFQGNNAVDYKHDVQVNASMVYFGGREANLQISYAIEFFNDYFLNSLHPGDYEVASDAWSRLISGKDKKGR